LGQPVDGLRAAFQGVLLLWGILSSAHSQEMPVGFKLERYAGIWQRNPFTLANPVALQPSRFAQLALTSWLVVGSKETISVEDSETKEVQIIAAMPNENNIRLVKLRLSSDPLLAEAVISDGNESGTVKVRYDRELSRSTTLSPLSQLQPGNTGVAEKNAAVVNSQAASGSDQTSGVPQREPVSQPPPNRVYPGIPRVRHEGSNWQESSARRRLGG
jgi:hypothetical protein